MSVINSEQFLNLIHDRHSTRSPFDKNHSIDKQDLQKILDAGRWAPTAHNMQNYEVLVVDDKDLLESLSKIESPISETFIKENYQQLSFSEEKFLQKKVGLLGTMFPPSMLKIPDEHITNKEMSPIGRFIDSSSILLVVVYDPSRRAPASEGDFLGIMSLGCVMENMWLMAQSLGIDFHIVSSLSNQNVEKKVKELLNIPSKLKIAISFRLGYALSPLKNYQRVRRDIEDFTHLNRYGTKLN